MSKVIVYNLEGKKTSDIDLDKNIFHIGIKKEVIHRVVVAKLSNKRNNIAKTKDRSEVSGGGIKPWKQKGTGRARHGSIRSPLWVGGGVTFGPTPERNYKKKINKKEQRKALFMVLTSKVEEKRLLIVEDLKLGKISTKNFLKMITKFPIKSESALVVLDKSDKIILKSSRNIPSIKTVSILNLSIIDLLKYDFLLIEKKALQDLQKMYQ